MAILKLAKQAGLVPTWNDDDEIEFIGTTKQWKKYEALERVYEENEAEGQGNPGRASRNSR